jgi:hypothetical protein
MFENDDTVRSLLTFRGGAPREFSRIKKMEADWRPEIGPETGFLHAHILFEITHTVAKPGIHLNIPAVKKAIARNAETPEVAALPYINVHGFSSRAALRAYLAKGDVADQLQAFLDNTP